MTVATADLGQVTIVRPQGRLDVNQSPALEAALEQLYDHGRVRVVLDLADIDYMSSAGLRVLSGILRPLRDAGGDLRLARPVPRVTHVLHVAGFHLVFGIYATVEAAWESFE